jgi:hypothetical protein
LGKITSDRTEQNRGKDGGEGELCGQGEEKVGAGRKKEREG